MEIDREKIKQRFSEINESVEEIRRLTSLDDKEFWIKKENIAAVILFTAGDRGNRKYLCAHRCKKIQQRRLNVWRML